MSVVEFKRRDAPKVPPTDGLDCTRWGCGGCDAEVFHLWMDGTVACAECGSLSIGHTNKVAHDDGQ